MRLDDRVVLLCGCGGLGRAVAQGLAEAGAALAVGDADLESARSLAADLEERGHRATSIQMDVSRQEDCGRAVERALELGPIYAAVNCAGINIREPSTEVSEDHWERVVAVNLKGAFFFAQAAARAMITRGQGGRILTLSSQMALVGMEDRAAYCASKGGVVSLSRALAVEWASYGITVNTVAPTFIQTALNATTLDDAGFRDRVTGRIPMGRLGRPEDVVGAVLYLLSDAAGFVTGVTLPVDGGWTAG